jgi:hypothetical protein
MQRVSGSRKVAATVGLFLAAVATVAISAGTQSGIPLFFAWIPLVGVGWVLTRPEPGTRPAAEADPSAAGSTAPDEP